MMFQGAPTTTERLMNTATYVSCRNKKYINTFLLKKKKCFNCGFDISICLEVLLNTYVLVQK